MKLTADQKKILNLLLDKYERSRTYEGTNRQNQSFSLKPEDVWKEYSSDFAGTEEIKDFENEIRELEEAGLITASEKYGVITKITACNESLKACYEILGRKEKSEIIREQLAFWNNIKDSDNEIISSLGSSQTERIMSGRKAEYDTETAAVLISVIKYIGNNRDELLERELSIRLFSDSKIFESKYRRQVCRILRKYGDFEEILRGVDDERECEKIILEEYNVYSNPSYIYLKGRAVLRFDDGSIMEVTESPVAVSSDCIKRLTSFTIEADTIMTVENLTSFHRISDKGFFYIFLSGYHNHAKQKLIRYIAKENPGRRWLHFGDIDPDGFYILMHLQKGTGIDFEPYKMGTEELTHFRKYTKTLNNNDRVKAENLMAAGRFTRIMKYMLENDCKLEQEIISARREKILRSLL